MIGTLAASRLESHYCTEKAVECCFVALGWIESPVCYWLVDRFLEADGLKDADRRSGWPWCVTILALGKLFVIDEAEHRLAG